MKKTKLLLAILVAVLILIFPINTEARQAKGATATDPKMAETTIAPENYKSNGPSDDDVTEMYKFGGSVAGIIQIVGTAVSVGTMIIIGIKYVIASADEKADYRSRMIPYFIGAVLLFGAANVVRLVDKIIN